MSYFVPPSIGKHDYDGQYNELVWYYELVQSALEKAELTRVASARNNLRETIQQTTPVIGVLFLPPIAAIIMNYYAPNRMDRIAAYGIECARAKTRQLLVSECGGTIAIYVRSLKSLRLPRNLVWYKNADELPIFKTEVIMNGSKNSVKSVDVTAKGLEIFMGGNPDDESDLQQRYCAIFSNEFKPEVQVINSLRKQLMGLLTVTLQDL